MLHLSMPSATSNCGEDCLNRLDHVLADLVGPLGNLGALVAIDVDGVGRAILTAGHSNLDKSREVGPDDFYRIGSQSKTVLAMTLLSMAHEGLVDLDKAVRHYLDLPIDPRITVRHLLMNASGMGEYTFPIFSARYDPRISYSPRDLIALALPQGQIFEPGDRFDYCNTGWVVAALVIETLTGKDYGDVIADRVVAPLGLKATAFGGKSPSGEPMRCYTSVSVTEEPVETTNCLSWAYGAGDGIASASDILAIYQSLTRERSPVGVSLQEMTKETKQPSANPYYPMSIGAEYGLGLELRAWAGSRVWGHPGSTVSCRSSTWIDPERGVAIATCVTGHIRVGTAGDDIRYPRAQLFSMALNTAYALAA